jgi:hypothetical protein
VVERLISAVLAGVLVSASALVGAQDKRISAAIQRQLDLPEQRIDIGVAALTFAKEVYPALDIDAYSRKLDVLAQKVRFLARGSLDPEHRVRVLNTVLFRDEGFRYDRDPFSRAREEYYYLNGILDTKKGICYTMPLLYIAVAQRVGYPIYPVAAPDHLFVRYVDPTFRRQNVETTSGGKFFTDDDYIKDFSVNDRALKSGSYMKTMTYREFLGHVLVTSTFAIRKQGNKVLAFLEHGVRLHPTHADFHLNLSEVYLAKSSVVDPSLAARLRERSQYHAARANDLGYVGPAEIAAGRAIRGKPQ